MGNRKASATAAAATLSLGTSTRITKHQEPGGGPDDDSNLQLLCGSCNTIKGTGTMAEPKAKLKAGGMID